MDLHRIGEHRSLAYHRVIAERVAADPSRLAIARAHIVDWGARRTLSEEYVARWLELLDGPLPALLAKLVEDSEDARALRQSTPFAGVLDARERRALHRSVRREIEGAQTHGVELAETR
ncbi:MAG: hypothetical protein K1X94_17020 [Sandaracinaceae bacterium]|nr:hypothetical protein [Sandaracinaceae bacterium]